MEQLSKEDLLELVKYLGSDADLDRSLQQWPEELRLLYELLVTDDAEADAFALQLLQVLLLRTLPRLKIQVLKVAGVIGMKQSLQRYLQIRIKALNH